MQSVCCIADVSLVNFGCVVTHIEPYAFSKTLLLEKISDNEVFGFAGHGIVGDCIRVSDRDENNPANSPLCSAEIPECKYNLVVINACRSAENSNFRSAFNANCFIGWRGDPTFAFVAKWERVLEKSLAAKKICTSGSFISTYRGNRITRRRTRGYPCLRKRCCCYMH